MNVADYFFNPEKARKYSGEFEISEHVYDGEKYIVYDYGEFMLVHRPDYNSYEGLLLIISRDSKKHIAEGIYMTVNPETRIVDISALMEGTIIVVNYRLTGLGKDLDIERTYRTCTISEKEEER